MNDKYIVKFNGGLGNQMFQFAFGLSLEKYTNIPVIFDMSFFDKKYARPYELNVFNLNIKKADNLWLKLKLKTVWKLRKRLNKKSFLGLNFYSEPHFEFDENLFKIKPNTYIEGFFQSEKYFKDIEFELRKNFRFKESFDETNQALIEKINQTNSVSIHIRRGDYIKKKRYQKVYAACSVDYYKRAVEYIAQRYDNPVLFIFSDDIPWVKENLHLSYETVHVTNNTAGKNYEDMHLMSLCRHNIIANSSFSWWGAWLNKNKDKVVIAPEKWFNDEKIVQTDIIPDNWIRMEN